MPYPFDQIFAADPERPEMVATNAPVVIFAPGDETKTPLTLTALNGLPLENPIIVNDRGFGPAFIADLDQVAWEGGGLTGLLASYRGLKDDAEAAAQEAGSARAAAEEAAERAAMDAAAAVEAVGTMLPRALAGDVLAAEVLTPQTTLRTAVETVARNVGGGSGGGGGGIAEVLGQYELQKYVNMGDSWSDPNRVNTTTGASPSERLSKRLSTAAITHRGFSSRTVEDLANINLGGTNGWTPGTKALVTITSCHLNNTKYLGTGPAAERGYKHAWRSLLSTLTAHAVVAANTAAFTYSPGWAAEVTTGSTTAQAANNSTGGTRFRTTTTGAYALVNITGPSVDVFAVARKAGAGVMTVTNNATGATLGTLDLTGPVAQEAPAVLKLRNLGTGTRTLRITHTSGASLTVDSIRIPTTNPAPIVLAPAPDVQNGGGNTLPAGDPSPNYNAAQATARAWVAEVAAEYPSVTICDLNGYGFDKVADFYTDLRHLNDRGAAKWASVVFDHLATRGFTQGLNVIGNDATPYNPPSSPGIPAGGRSGDGSVEVPPQQRTFQDSSHEWFPQVGASTTTVRDIVGEADLVSTDSAPTYMTENGRGFWRFRGTSANPDSLLNDSTARPAAETIAALVRVNPASLSSTRRFILSSGNTSENPQSTFGFTNDLTNHVMSDGMSLSFTPPLAPDSAWHVMIVVRNGSNSILAVDDREVTGNAGSAVAKTGYRVARANNGTAASSTAMDLAGMVTFDYAADEARRAEIISTLRAMIP